MGIHLDETKFKQGCLRDESKVIVRIYKAVPQKMRSTELQSFGRICNVSSGLATDKAAPLVNRSTAERGSEM